MNEREDVWPQMLRWLPAPSTMSQWATEVDAYLKVKAMLDRQQRVQPPHPDGRPQTSAPAE